MLGRAIREIGGRSEEVGLPGLILDALSSMPFGRLEETVCLLLSRMGYAEVQTLGRNGFYGKSPAAGSDIGGRTPSGTGGEPVLVQVRQYGGEKIRTRMVDELRGACLREQAAHGVLVTTSSFAAGASQAARRGGAPRALCIDGNTLAELCIAHGVGVRTEQIEALVLDRPFFGAKVNH